MEIEKSGRYNIISGCVSLGQNLDKDARETFSEKAIREDSQVVGGGLACREEGWMLKKQWRSSTSAGQVCLFK